jgi:hypothetical protein
MTNDVIKQNELGKALSHGALDGEAHALDTRHVTDRRIALAKSAVDTRDDGLVIDIAKVGSIMSEKFAIAPIRFCGERLRRLRCLDTGEVSYFVGGRVLGEHVLRFEKWRMHFEPGVVMGAHHSGGWRTSAPVVIPHVPAEYRPANPRGHFILWEQEFTERILRPRDPALLEHVVGDVYVVLATWDLTELEAAALRGHRA